MDKPTTSKSSKELFPKLPPKSSNSFNPTKRVLAPTTGKIPKKSNPPKSEDVSNKKLFEFTIHSKNKFPSTTVYPVQDLTSAQKVILKRWVIYGKCTQYFPRTYHRKRKIIFENS